MLNYKKQCIAENAIRKHLKNNDPNKLEVRVQRHKCKGIQINIDNAKFVDDVYQKTNLEVKDISVEIVSNKIADIILSTNITKIDFKIGTDLTDFNYKGTLINLILGKLDPTLTDVAFFAAFLLCPMAVPMQILKPHGEMFFKNWGDFDMDRPLFATTWYITTKGKRYLKFNDCVKINELTIDFDPQSKGVSL